MNNMSRIHSNFENARNETNKYGEIIKRPRGSNNKATFVANHTYHVFVQVYVIIDGN